MVNKIMLMQIMLGTINNVYISGVCHTNVMMKKFVLACGPKSLPYQFEYDILWWMDAQV